MRRRTTDRKHNGHALIELLAVLFIVATLAAMIVPAPEPSRHIARRLHCANNLPQLCMALHIYEQDRLVFPSGVVDLSGPIDERERGWHLGLIAHILPYLEQLPVFETIDMQASIYAAENQTARRMQLNTLLCPVDVNGNMKSLIGKSSYAGCHHDVEAPIDVDNHGVFFLNSRISYEDITDGSGNTILLGEKRTPRDDAGWMAGTRATLRNTGARINTLEDDSPKGHRERPPLFVGGFGSAHPRGANFGFGDGSVRFVSETVDMDLYRHLGRRDDGELVNSGPY